MPSRPSSRLLSAALVIGALAAASPAAAQTKLPDPAAPSANAAITEHQPYGVGSGRKVG